MSETSLRQIRVLHLVSAGGVVPGLQQSLFMPLLTRMPKARVKSQVVCLAPGVVPATVLRQHGIPVYEAPLSRQRFSFNALAEITKAAQLFKPDVIQAWGHTAQLVACYVRRRCDWRPQLLWNFTHTPPLARAAGLLDRQKLKLLGKLASKVDRIIYASDAGAAHHRRAGLPEDGSITIAPGVDAARHRPDQKARRKLREHLQLPRGAFVIGMLAPFLPESDHATLLKGVGELVKTQPEVNVVLAGHGVSKGNATLMALIGGGALSTRVHLLGEWSDVSSLFNACDVVCSSALHDEQRMQMVMAMLCGAPCVATGIGAQGEILGEHGLAIEPGSPAAFIKALTRILQLTSERRADMVKRARKHALRNYVHIRALQRYLQLYQELIGQEVSSAPMPEPAKDTDVDAREDEAAAPRKAVVIEAIEDPESLEAQVDAAAPETLPQWRVEASSGATAAVATPSKDGDVLDLFEASISSDSDAPVADADHVSALEEDLGELLAPELLETDAPAPRAVSSGPKPVRSEPAEAPRKADAMERMRNAARQELQRAAAAQAQSAKR